MRKIVLEQVLELIKLNETLETLYDKLAELEISHKQNSQEYDKYISYIQLSLDVINRKIKKMELTDKDLVDIDYELAELNGYNEENHDLIIDLLELTTNNKIRRTCMQIYNLSRETGSGYYIEDTGKEYLDEDLTDEDTEEMDNLAEQLLDGSMKEEYEVELLKDKLLSHTLMEYLLDAIEKEKNPIIKNELIRVKYRLIYLLNDLERNFVNSPKKFSKLAIYHEILKYKNIEDKDLFEEIYTEPIKDTVLFEIDYLIDLSEEYFNDIKNYIKVFLRILYIKSLISINFDKQVENELQEKMNILIESINTKEYIKNACQSFDLKKELCVPKNVDLS